MGVLANLSGNPAEPLPDVADRKFLDIDIDNFDQRLKAMKPRVAFQVPNTLTGDGNLMIDLSFDSMDDFSPAAVARKVDALRTLLEARQHLANLLTYMDGKTGAEQLIRQVLQDPTLLQALASAPKPTEASADAPPNSKPSQRGRTMATEKQSEGQSGTLEVSELEHLLQKE